MKTLAMMGISAACLIFTGWAIATMQHRQATPPEATQQQVKQWGTHV